MSSCGTPTAASSYCPAFCAHTTSPKSQKSLTGHSLFHLTPVQIKSLSLWHSPSWRLVLQLRIISCSLYGCRLDLPDFTHSSKSLLPWVCGTPSSGPGPPALGRERATKLRFLTNLSTVHEPHLEYFPFNF